MCVCVCVCRSVSLWLCAYMLCVGVRLVCCVHGALPFFVLPKCPRVQMRAVVHRYMHRTHTHRVKGRWCGRSDESPEHTCMQYGQPVSLCLGVRVTGVCVLFFLVTCCCFSYCLPCMCTSGLHAETHNTRTHTHIHTRTRVHACTHLEDFAAFTISTDVCLFGFCDCLFCV